MLTSPASYLAKRQVKVSLAPLTGTTASTGLVQVVNGAGTVISSGTGDIGISAIVPVARWVTDYFVLIPSIRTTTTTTPTTPVVDYQVIVITANTDNTLVLVQFRGKDVKVNLEGGVYSEGVPLGKTLNAGQTLQLVELNGNDMSGTRVTATANIAVFGGITSGRVSDSGTASVAGSTPDTVFEQMPVPEYFILTGTNQNAVIIIQSKVNLKIKSKAFFKAVALVEGATVTSQQDPPPTNAGAGSQLADVGDMLEGTFGNSMDHQVLKYNKPCLIALLLKSGTGTSDWSAPALVFPPPLSQWQLKYVITNPATIAGVVNTGYKIGVFVASKKAITVTFAPTAAAQETPSDSGTSAIYQSQIYILGTDKVYTTTTTGTDTHGVYVVGRLDPKPLAAFAYTPGRCMGPIRAGDTAAVPQVNIFVIQLY